MDTSDQRHLTNKAEVSGQFVTSAEMSNRYFGVFGTGAKLTTQLGTSVEVSKYLFSTNRHFWFIVDSYCYLAWDSATSFIEEVFKCWHKVDANVQKLL